jgi:hypothetical protein
MQGENEMMTIDLSNKSPQEMSDFFDKAQSKLSQLLADKELVKDLLAEIGPERLLNSLISHCENEDFFQRHYSNPDDKAKAAALGRMITNLRKAREQFLDPR